MAPASKKTSKASAAPAECDNTVLQDAGARTEILNRLRRAEGQLRGIQRMVEEGEDCLKIGQQFAAVRKLAPDDTQKAGLATLLKDMETLLARMG
ncbi:MAG: metal-sensing transcriptional repressor [Curvibacter sp.]